MIRKIWKPRSEVVHKNNINEITRPPTHILVSAGTEYFRIFFFQFFFICLVANYSLLKQKPNLNNFVWQKFMNGKNSHIRIFIEISSKQSRNGNHFRHNHNAEHNYTMENMWRVFHKNLWFRSFFLFFSLAPILVGVSVSLYVSKVRTVKFIGHTNTWCMKQHTITQISVEFSSTIGT